MLYGLARKHAERVVEARGGRPFSSLEEFVPCGRPFSSLEEFAPCGRPFSSLEEFAWRTGLSRPTLVRLAKAGAFGSLGMDRRGALWAALAQDRRELPLFAPRMGTEPPVPLPGMSPAEEVLADYRTAGLSLRGHPMEFLRAELRVIGATPAAELRNWPNGKPVRVAGIVLVRQRPSTAKGITFVTLEDETGMANLIVRPGVWKRCREAALGATVLLVSGQLQRQGEIIHVLATCLEDLSGRMKSLGSQSRDFC
jgi:error-prone DNA polymerase